MRRSDSPANVRPGGGAPRLEVAESEAIEDVDAVAPGGGGDGKRRASEYARERKFAVTCGYLTPRAPALLSYERKRIRELSRTGGCAVCRLIFVVALRSIDSPRQI